MNAHHGRLARCAAAVGALALSAAAGDALAHLGDLSYSNVVVRDDAVAYRIEFAAHLIPSAPPGRERLTRAEVVALEPDILAWLGDNIRIESNAGRCRPSILDMVGPSASDDLTVTLGYRCPAAIEGLRIEFHPFDEAIPGYRNIVSLTMAGATHGFVFRRESPVLRLGALAVEGGNEGERGPFVSFFALGVEHIWTGYDHLLFLIALFLPGGTLARIAAIVTAFTVAHSVTLSLAVLGVVTLPPEPVEIAIAASIVYAAVRALRTGGADRRWLLTFFFGLVHGFGFAGALTEAGLPPGNVAVPLVAFNLGVEAGQLVVVAAAVPVLRWLLAGTRERRLRPVIAWLIIAAGVFWIGQRSADLMLG